MIKIIDDVAIFVGYGVIFTVCGALIVAVMIALFERIFK